MNTQLEKSTSQVLIIGGGIIGLSTAVQLAEKGVQVTLIEKNKIGFGCSYGNAGWMTPCFAMPLPMPGLLLKSMKWMIDPEGPLYIKPVPSVLLMKWLTKFLTSMTQSQAETAIEALVKLSQVSLDGYRALSQEYPEIGFEKKGLLMVGQSKDGVKAAVEEMNLVDRHGIPGKQMSVEEIKSFEPSLTGHLEGGVYFPEEAHGEPLKVVQALAKKAQKLGVDLREGVEFIHPNLKGSQIESIMTSQGILRAEKYVLATGSWSEELAKALRLSIPILGGKGYSMIVPPLSIQPKHSMMLVEKKIAITPRNGSLRIAGTLELVRQDFSITQRRVNAIIKGAREFLPVPQDLHVQELWRGLRPCTPDGVPLIGFSQKVPNLMLACGHQMLGLQAGFGTGTLVADLIVKGKSDLDRQVYSPDRF